MRLRWLALPVFLAGLWSMIFHPWAWAYGIGIHPYPGPQTPWTYQLYSGFLPALTVLSLATLLAGAWHHVNCHEDGCWRIGKHKVNGTPWCSSHQEKARLAGPATADDVVAKIEELIAVIRDVQRAPAP